MPTLLDLTANCSTTDVCLVVTRQLEAAYRPPTCLHYRRCQQVNESAFQAFQKDGEPGRDECTGTPFNAIL